jgi:hypothetical protein
MIEPPKPWGEAYLKQCAEDEIALAQLMRLGRFAAPAGMDKDTLLVRAPVRGGGFLRGANNNQRMTPEWTGELPRWRRDWVAAGELSTKLGLNTYHDTDEGSVSVSAGGRRRNVTERYEDHPSKDAATWAAIVGAAIQKLEAGNT